MKKTLFLLFFPLLSCLDDTFIAPASYNCKETLLTIQQVADKQKYYEQMSANVAPNKELTLLYLDSARIASKERNELWEEYESVCK